VNQSKVIPQTEAMGGTSLCPGVSILVADRK